MSETKQDEIALPQVTSTEGFVVRNATGPRTPAGKKRSRQNAMTYGIFAKDVVLSSESRSQFNLLLSRLIEDRHPEGALEHILVVKLATNVWRYWRLLRAVTATDGNHSIDPATTLMRIATNSTPELLIRYEVALERGFEKILVQLERLQRMRRGESVAPPLNVNITSP
jgi:hypothetical protein